MAVASSKVGNLAFGFSWAVPQPARNPQRDRQSMMRFRTGYVLSNRPIGLCPQGLRGTSAIALHLMAKLSFTECRLRRKLRRG